VGNAQEDDSEQSVSGEADHRNKAARQVALPDRGRQESGEEEFDHPEEMSAITTPAGDLAVLPDQNLEPDFYLPAGSTIEFSGEHDGITAHLYGWRFEGTERWYDIDLLPKSLIREAVQELEQV
jgi:hypothetical protein